MVWQPNSSLKGKFANMHKTEEEIIGRRDYEPIQSLYEQVAMNKTKKNIFNSQQDPLP